MYFAIDLDTQTIETEDGDTYTGEQFQALVEHAASNDKFFDMTLMTQRFVSMNYDFDALEEYYNTN